MLRTIVVDDEPMSLKRFAGLLAKTGRSILTGTYSDPDMVLEQVPLQQVDVAFIDIEMPGINGLLLAKKMQEINPKLDIIMVTAHDQYALEAFQAHAVGYILKPAEWLDVDRHLEILAAKREQQTAYQQVNRLIIQSFGGFQCYIEEDDITHIKWRTAKTRELLAILHSLKGNPVSRDVILEALWQEMDTSRASKNFHATSYYLREALRGKGLEGIFQRINGMYYLQMEDIQSDEAAFLALTEGSDMQRMEESVLQDISTIYRGAYCEGEDYPWADKKRIMYSSIATTALKILIERLIEQQKWEKAMAVVLQLLRLDPYDETGHETMIHLYLSQHNLTAAYDHYRQAKKIFQEELGVDPPEILLEKLQGYQQNPL